MKTPSAITGMAGWVVIAIVFARKRWMRASGARGRRLHRLTDQIALAQIGIDKHVEMAIIKQTRPARSENSRP